MLRYKTMRFKKTPKNCCDLSNTFFVRKYKNKIVLLKSSGL